MIYFSTLLDIRHESRTGARISTLLFISALTFAANCGHASPIKGQVEQYPTTTFQEFTLFGGTPVNPGPEATFPVVGTGYFVFDFSDENEATKTIQITVPENEFVGTNPLGSYVLRATDLSGAITNVQKSEKGELRSSFDSGFLEISGFFRREITDGPGAGLVFYTNEPTVFAGEISGLPIPTGTTLTSPDPLDVFVILGTEEIQIGRSFNRSVTIAPEPSDAQPQPNDSVTLSIARHNEDNLEISWTDRPELQLQAAPSIEGPYYPVLNRERPVNFSSEEGPNILLPPGNNPFAAGTYFFRIVDITGN